MEKRFTLILISILCVFFIEGCGILFDPNYFKSHSSEFLLDAGTDIPKRIGIIRFQTSDPGSDIVNDEFSKRLTTLGFYVVETDEHRGVRDCEFYCGRRRVRMEKIMDLSEDYRSENFKEFRNRLKEKFDIEAILIGTVLGGWGYADTYICVDLIDLKTGRIIWTGASHNPAFAFKNTVIPTTRKLLRRLESDIESHNEARKNKPK